MRRPKREPSEAERLEVIRTKHAAGQTLADGEVQLLLAIVKRQEQQLWNHPAKRRADAAEETLRQVSLRAHWREELLELVEQELRKLAAEPARSASDRARLLRRAERIAKRLEENEPPEGWSPVGIPGQEWRADPE